MSAIGRRMNNLKTQVSVSRPSDSGPWDVRRHDFPHVTNRLPLRATQLMNVRNGPGAAKLPQNVTKIHMEFAHKWDDGHFGSRKFWRDHLPRLKYHNPQIPMIVNRTRDQHGPATLSIYVRGSDAEGSSQKKGSAAAASDAWSTIRSSSEGRARAPEPAEGETVVTINMKNVRSDEILKQFMEKSGASQLEPTPEDREEMARLAELQERAVYDREVQRRYREKIQSEKRLLEKARQEADALKADK